MAATFPMFPDRVDSMCAGGDALDTWEFTGDPPRRASRLENSMPPCNSGQPDPFAPFQLRHVAHDFCES